MAVVISNASPLIVCRHFGNSLLRLLYGSVLVL